MKKFVSILICLLVFAQCNAKVITVDNESTADFSSIQAAIDSASEADIIIVQPGIYQERIKFLGKNIILTSTNPSNPMIVESTLIEGELAFNPTGYIEDVVTFRGDETSACKLIGFKINGPVGGYDRAVFPSALIHTRATMTNCVIEYVPTECGTIIYGFDGELSNCVIGFCKSVHQCIVESSIMYACHGTIRNCTIIGNINSAIEIAENKSLSVINSILRKGWQFGKTIKLGSGASVDISYSNLENGLDGIQLADSSCVINWGHGNIDEDPCFVRVGLWEGNYPDFYFTPGDYHLQSEAGRWYPDMDWETWVTDDTTSLCIDAGNPGCPVGSERVPNGDRVEMGAYGGTATASKSPANWRSKTDLNNDWNIGFNDLVIFVQYWLQDGQCLPSDLNRNSTVNMIDFAIFAEEWVE